MNELIKTDASKISTKFVLAVASTKSYGMCEAQPRLEAVLAKLANHLSTAEKSAVWADLVVDGWRNLVVHAEQLVADDDHELYDMVYGMRQLAVNEHIQAGPLLNALQIGADEVMLKVQRWRYQRPETAETWYEQALAGVSAAPDLAAWAVRRGLVDAAEVGLRSDAHELHMYRTGLVMRDDMERARARRWDRSDAE